MNAEMLKSVLQDSSVVKYLLQHEDVVTENFSVPTGESPSEYIVQLSNHHTGSGSGFIDDEFIYRKSPLYSTILHQCMVCNNKLKVKKAMRARLYDDVLGTLPICLITKYCSSCKLTYYPGYAENYEAKQLMYEKNWRAYGIFVSNHKSCFSIDFMDMTVSLKLRMHATFMGRADAYNHQHKYQLGEEDAQSLDKRVIGDAYYKFTLLEFRERYGLHLCFNMNVEKTLDEELTDYVDLFMQKGCTHACNVEGCSTCVVIDGHMKAHRKICGRKGCTMDPKDKSKFCDVHHLAINQGGNAKEVLHEAQVLNHGEYHIERILKTIMIKKRRHYVIKWVGWDETTNEPKENLPRVLTELFDLYGDSTIPTIIKTYFESKAGIKYVVLNVENRDDLILPACSLQVDEDAYFLPSPSEDDCNTEKTKSRFYHRTGGVLAMGRPCGYIVNIAEIYGGESVHQVADLVESFLSSLPNPSDTKVALYDDGCHLKLSVDKRKPNYPYLSNVDIKIDRFHYKNHKNKWCRENMNPDSSKNLKNVNTEAMEQAFAWLKGYAPSLRYMKRVNFVFVILDMIDRRNMNIDRR